MLLRNDTVTHLGAARHALKGLDVPVPNLQAALPELVAAYKKVREIVDAGHGPKGEGGAKPA